MTVLDYRFFINQLKINIAQQQFYFDCIMNTQVKVFVKVLYRLGVVRRFIRLNDKRFRVYPNWVGGRSTLKSIRFFQKKTPLKISYKTLRLLKYYTFSSTLLLETDLGLITHQEATKRKVGGNLVCLIL